MVEEIQSLSIGNFPFYWRTKSLTNAEVEVDTISVDFFLTYDSDCGFFKQYPSAELSRAIESVYHLDHNIGYLQAGAEEFQTYGLEYLNVIRCALDDHIKRDARFSIVDIGCGGGSILNEIKKIYPNSKLYGVDPSPVAERASAEFNFDLIKDFYPSQSCSEMKDLDLILNYDVIEHVPNPLAMLQKMYQDLRVGGLLIFSVPDCSAAIENGDISMCIHEHLNYFSVASLKRLVEKASFQNVRVFQGKHGGTLFCVAERGAAQQQNTKPAQTLNFANDFSQFVLKHENLCRKLKKFLDYVGESTIGFYVPLRTIPYITKLGLKGEFRFYDDSAFFKHRLLDGFENNKILGIDDMESDPPEFTLVMTHAYGSLIKQRIEERCIDTTVATIEEFYER